MENTIKKDNNRLIIHSDYLNDNCCLECIYIPENQSVTVAIRYIDELRTIRETILLVLTMDEYISDFSELLQINKEKDTIAIFNKKDNNLLLRDVYDTKEHTMAIEEIKDLIFKKKFPQELLGKNLELIKKPVVEVK